MNYVFGHHSVAAVLENNTENVTCLYLQIGKDFSWLQHFLDRHTFKVQWVNKEELNKLTGLANHQGIVAAIATEPKNYTENDLENILNTINEPAFLLILDGVQDPHNLGACLRSANAAGAHAIIVPKDNAVGLTPVVHKVASGAALVTPLIQVTNLSRTMRELKQRGIWLFATDDQADETIYQADFKIPLAIVLGAEGKGLRRLTKENCDFHVRIPMLGTVPSLNVSVAAGICLFEVVRQRSRLDIEVGLSQLSHRG
jgi:23S rRNA (guanosine2251-2'-O)-methyltransferase